MDTTKENLNGSKERLNHTEYSVATVLVIIICYSIVFKEITWILQKKT
ncbi:hypothetical protein KVC20_03345 [Helicobacter pylori]|nr:hypothetical protein KVC20_03345 [Helicobacter pylori]